MTVPNAEGPATCPDVIIIGAAKSGTTALFYAIKSSMEEHLGKTIDGLFEPRGPKKITSYLESSPDSARVCKVLLANMLRQNMALRMRFDKRVVIFRDPRDNVVSRLLYMPGRLLAHLDQSKADAFLDIIRQKEADPTSISMTELIAELGRLTDRDDLMEDIRQNAILPAEMASEEEGTHYLMPYVKLVDGDFSALSNYLGFTVNPKFAVSDQHQYVARSKGYGEWRDWFRPEDMQFFVHDVADKYGALGYDPEEQPAANPSIDPAIGSEYLAKQIERVRSKGLDVRQRKRQRRRERAKDPETAKIMNEERRARREKRSQSPIDPKG